MRMRFVLCVVAAMTGSQAIAADMPDMFLRGSNTVINVPGGVTWEGFYVGGQVGATYSGADFRGASTSLLRQSLRNSIYLDAGVQYWDTLGTYDTTSSSYGGFAGYNYQWDEAVVGIEFNYNRTNAALSSTGAMGRQPQGIPDAVYVNAAASVKLTDYGTARARGGWAAGNFMPYGFVGLALGRADVRRSTTVRLAGPSGAVFFTDTVVDDKLGDLAYGYTAGLGIDVAVMQNFFVRAEYEYVKFGAFNDINLHIHTARVGAGVKF